MENLTYFFALILLLNSFAFPLNSVTDKHALISFKNSVASDPFAILSTNWLQNTSVCNWIGVSCGLKHDRVTALDLYGYGLAGTVAPHLGNLTFLRYLDISNNSFTGILPFELSKLRRLKVMDAGQNSFTGEIPTWLGSLPKLEELYLDNNSFLGKIPSSLFNNSKLHTLQILHLHHNKLSGSIPHGIFNVSSLRDITIKNNSLSSWLPSDMCNNMPNIQILSLSYNRLEGQIPSNTWKCTHLEMLSLSFNNFSGNIPHEIGKLRFLTKLYLGYNNGFPGGVPPEIGNLTKLEILNIDRASLTGDIPFSIFNMSSLKMLSFYDNSLSGSIPTFQNLPRLKALYLDYNKFTGSFPPIMGNMKVLSVSNNSLEWDITSTTFPKNCSLLALNLNGNKLEGALPQSLSNCLHLIYLDVGNNRIRDTFPVWTGNLAGLSILVLRSNNFSGTISSLTSKTRLPFPMLHIFDISHNAFIGNLPNGYLRSFKEMMDVHEDYRQEQYGFPFYTDSFTLTLKGMDRILFRIQKTLTIIDMSSNRFSGSIPNSIGKLKSLIYLNLSHNCLTGVIPSSLGNVSALEALDLSSNQLVGEIPTELTKLTFLSVINLSMNHLSGKIPQSNGQFSTFEITSYVGNSGLCGLPLSRKCDEPEPELEPPVMLKEDDHDYGILEGFCWQAVVSGYGCGFVIGAIVGGLILGYGRPKWLVEWIYRFYRIKMRSRRGNVAPQRRRR